MTKFRKKLSIRRGEKDIWKISKREEVVNVEGRWSLPVSKGADIPEFV